MTEQEIEHVAKAIYLVRIAPRRFPRDWNELSVEPAEVSKRMPSPRSRRSTH
jgi:hypothetical protein